MKVTHGRKILNGDIANMSIGQGDIQVTPLQMAQAMAIVANGNAWTKRCESISRWPPPTTWPAGSPTHRFSGFTLSVCQLRPGSRGFVRIVSNDPLALAGRSPGDGATAGASACSARIC